MIILERRSIVDFLKKHLTNNQRKTPQDLKFLVILPHEIAKRNFLYTTMIQGISSSISESMTFDDLAQCILDPDKNLGLRILDRQTLGQMMAKTIEEATSGPLKELQLIPLENSETQEVLVEEFDEYLRGTDTGALSSFLSSIANDLEDPFASKSSTRIVEAFRILEQMILMKISNLGISVFLSRAHYLKKANETLAFRWPSVLGTQEILISDISVFDATILKFVASIAEIGEKRNSSFRVRIFQENGTYTQLRKRLEKAGVKFAEEKIEISNHFWRSELLKTYHKKGSLGFIAVPERRREIEIAAKRIHELLLQGIHPSEILLVARDCGKYLSLVSEIFPAFGIPYFVQTRRPYAHLSPYRFVKATLDLILAAHRNDVKWHEITDPLRLGFCLSPGRKGWPIGSKQFIYLEESLSRMQHRMKGPISLRDWRKRVLTELRWDYPSKLLTEFLDWIQDRLDSPPKEPREVRHMISTLLAAYMFQQSPWSRKSYSPRVQSQERFSVVGLHPTHFATTIRNDLSELENYIQDCIRGLGQTLTWELITKSFGEVFGIKAYGLPDQDMSSIKIADAANISFLKAKYLFMMGLKADEFPRECPKGIFIPDKLREALDEPKDGEAAFLYLRSSSSDYANEYDYLEIVLRTSPEIIWCSMPYLDERGHVCEWSSFFDEFRPGEEEKNRILPDKWLPTASRNKWEETAKEYPPWVRQRLYSYHAHRKFPHLDPSIDKKGLEELASTLDPDFYSAQIKDRIERYLTPPSSIEVHGDEPWFSGCSLQSISGPPFRTHEMDLHATCPMQWYFWQFLFLWDGMGVDRDTIPIYFKNPHWRYGRLPKRLSYVYPCTRTNERIKEIIEKRFPDRQESLLQFSDKTSFENHLATFLSEFEQIQFGNTLADERALVKQEKRDNITRQWAWNSTNKTVEVGQGNEKVQIILPPHRVDDLQGTKFIVAYVNFSGQLEDEKPGLFYSKKGKKMDEAKDPLRDHRIPVLLIHYLRQGGVAAAMYAELFNAQRLGYYDKYLLMKHKGPRGYEEELKMPFANFDESRKQVLEPLEMMTRIDQFSAAILQRAKKMSPNPNLRFEARSQDESTLPQEEVCQRCVYNDLCQIPRAEGLR
jgi:hypothetical protein